MGKTKDLTGMRFGRLVALKKTDQNYKNNAIWLCKCDCGNEIVAIAHNLLRNNTTSCGCKRKETIKQMAQGYRGTRLYQIWQNMKNRCRNNKTIGYKNYGGRGINYCEQWEQFKPFYEWAMSNGYQDNLSIDRIDVNGDYTPQNCKWSTPKEQSRNKRDNRYICFNNQNLILEDWATITGIERRTLQYRIDHGWKLSDAFYISPKMGSNQHNTPHARD